MMPAETIHHNSRQKPSGKFSLEIPRVEFIRSRVPNGLLAGQGVWQLWLAASIRSPNCTFGTGGGLVREMAQMCALCALGFLTKEFFGFGGILFRRLGVPGNRWRTRVW